MHKQYFSLQSCPSHPSHSQPSHPHTHHLHNHHTLTPITFTTITPSHPSPSQPSHLSPLTLSHPHSSALISRSCRMRRKMLVSVTVVWGVWLPASWTPWQPLHYLPMGTAYAMNMEYSPRPSEMGTRSVKT